ncbi:hepatitis A virus cellular receptor 1 homolog [Centroberyx affinis]|uniref:hepatitis A virus cellular receptor 1 homolog n=1 Tax=Centroberyx affinis TaxID=166261 RepID=UPI003A5BF2A9
MRPLCYLLFSLLTRVCKGTSTVIGFIGHNVTLPCSYDTHTHGMLGTCWGQGKVPQFKCANTILSSWDGTVDFKQSPRYQLLGRVGEGDVSLTILRAQRSDAGVYGCRVEVPGWFNDLKANTHLVIEEAPVEQPVTQVVLLPTSRNMLPTGGRLEMLTTSVFEEMGNDEPAMDFDISEERFKAFPGTENIGRMAAIFSSTIIIILVLIFWRRSPLRRTPEHAENDYEDMQMPE